MNGDRGKLAAEALENPNALDEASYPNSLQVP